MKINYIEIFRKQELERLQELQELAIKEKSPVRISQVKRKVLYQEILEKMILESWQRIYQNPFRNPKIFQRILLIRFIVTI